MSTKLAGDEHKSSTRLSFFIWTLVVTIPIALVVVCTRNYIDPHKHPLGVTGALILLVAILMLGYSISLTYKRDATKIERLERIKKKLADGKYSNDVLHLQINELLDLSIADWKERKENGINAAAIYAVSAAFSMLGTFCVVRDLVASS